MSAGTPESERHLTRLFVELTTPAPVRHVTPVQISLMLLSQRNCLMWLRRCTPVTPVKNNKNKTHLRYALWVCALLQTVEVTRCQDVRQDNSLNGSQDGFVGSQADGEVRIECSFGIIGVCRFTYIVILSPTRNRRGDQFNGLQSMLDLIVSMRLSNIQTMVLSEIFTCGGAYEVRLLFESTFETTRIYIIN